MAVRNDLLGGTDYVDGETIEAEDANDTNDAIYENIGRLGQVYTGTGYDSTQSGSGGDTENDHELAVIPSSFLVGADYLILRISAKTIATGGGAASGAGAYTGTVYFKFQTKEVGGSYSDSIAYTKIKEASGFTNNASGFTYKIDQVDTLTFMHELTSGEKTNGVQIKLFSKSENNNANANATFNNVITAVFTNPPLP